MPTYFDIPDMFGRYINEVPGGALVGYQMFQN